MIANPVVFSNTSSPSWTEYNFASINIVCCGLVIHNFRNLIICFYMNCKISIRWSKHVDIIPEKNE